MPYSRLDKDLAGFRWGHCPFSLSPWAGKVSNALLIS